MKNFFKGISFSQIGAGALAAVTSFLLSAKIGLAGSVIGVAIGSIVSALSSQIYQNVLKESSKKLQEAAPFSVGGADASVHTDETSMVVDDDTKVFPRQSGNRRTPDHHASGPRVIASDGTIEPRSSHSSVLDSSGSPHVTVPDVGTSASNTQRHKRIAIIVSVVSALVAVLITAGIITVVTRGKGTDDVVRNWTGNSSIRRQRPSQTPTPDQRSAQPSTTPSPSDTRGSTTPSPESSSTPPSDGSHNSNGSKTDGGNGGNSNSTGNGTNGSNGSNGGQTDGSNPGSGSGSGTKGGSSDDKGAGGNTGQGTSGNTQGSGSDSKTQGQQNSGNSSDGSGTTSK